LQGSDCKQAKLLMNDPMNDLERAFAKMARGPEARPEFFRLLRESELSFLLPYHPEIEGEEMELKNGDPMPPFVVWQNKKGSFIPVFTSDARADAAVAKQTEERRFQKCPYSVGSMNGEVLFVTGRIKCSHFGPLKCASNAATLR